MKTEKKNENETKQTNDKTDGILSSTCVCCGAYVPEGERVCTNCKKEGKNYGKM